MFAGGGFLGVGPAELFVIGVVGWLVLGPQRLYEVSRDAGKVLGSLRKTADDARNSFKEALEVDSLGMDLSDPLGLGSSVAATKARKLQEKEERERAEEAEAAGGAAPSPTPVAGAADAVAAAVSTEPAGPAAAVSKEPAGPAPAPAAAARSSPAAARAAAAALTVGSAVPEELMRKPDAGPGEEEMKRFQEQLRRVSDPNQKADLDGPAMAAALAANPLPPLAGDVPAELDVPTDVALAELEAAYAAAKKKLLLKGLAEMEAKAEGENGQKTV